jgi:lipoprotein-anchoring transpeptidase ErfK/SrfK
MCVRLASVNAFVLSVFVLQAAGVARAAGQDPTRQPPPAGATVDATRDEILLLQVRLDRAGFSPGAIDGRWGGNTRKALKAFAAAHGLPRPTLDERPPKGLEGLEEIAARLPRVNRDALAKYTITDADVAGPFARPLPDDLEAQAAWPALTYETVREAIAERFHSSEALLDSLNPGARYVAGETLTVPDVEPMPVVAPPFEQTIDRGKPQTGDKADTSDARGGVSITVSRSTGALTVRRDDDVVLHAPATTGSRHDPLPLGDWTVTALVRQPKFHYNPELFWDADPGDAPATLPPGPNNPVGLVWIDLSREHYGIHGTPKPSSIGHTESHGCVRLTNWDVLRVAALVAPGTPVHFVR